MKIIDSRLRFTEKLGNFELERNLELRYSRQCVDGQKMLDNFGYCVKRNMKHSRTNSVTWKMMLV